MRTTMWKRVLWLAGCGVTTIALATPSGVAAQDAIPRSVEGPASGPVPDAYRIAAGDQIAVTFPYNAELNIAGPVGPDGRFAMPVIGNLLLGGRTIEDATTLIADALRRAGVVEHAYPNVAIQQYGAVVYVGGEVRAPGPVKMQDRLDPLQAVISAGGLLETARAKQVVVIHRNVDGTIVQTHANLRAYAHKGVSTGITLQSQDIVFVPRSSIAEADLWIDQHVNRLLPFGRSLNYSIGNTTVNSVVGR